MSKNLNSYEGFRKKAIKEMMAFMKKNNVNRKQLSSALGVTPTYILLIMNGKKDPSMKFIAKAFDYMKLEFKIIISK